MKMNFKILQILKDKIAQAKGISWLDSLYKTIIFRDFCIAAFPVCLRWRAERIKREQQKTIARLRQQDKCRVLFFLQTPSVWKYDALYRKMVQLPYFEPIVVISPYNVHLIYDKQECLRVMRQTEEFAHKQGYQYVSAYDWEKKQWMDVRKIYKPDVIFFSKPYKDTLPAYHIYRYKKALTLYVPYGLTNLKLFHNHYGLPFYSLLWKHLVETEFHFQDAVQYQKNKGANAELVGALVMENVMRPDYQPKDVWKPQEMKKKRIIWAPHHTVDYLFNFSNFLTCCEDMLRLAEKYNEEVQFAFKPHPVLKFKLINIWGVEKTEAYYRKWEDLENGQIEQGEYIDLFKSSDAMIHDCASFTSEYLYTFKPVLFQVKDDTVQEQWKPFGQACFAQHYHAYSIEETEAFIRDVVIAGNDPKKEEREQFYKNYLYPKDGVMPSDKIISLLQTAIGK